jgi:DNA topoisomerase-1
MSNLLVVESPAKSNTIESFLGKDYKAIATIGHIKDLPKKEMGVDIEKGFDPKYVTVRKGKKSVMKNLREAIKETDGDIYLATDPDREGEMIAWHVDQMVDKLGKKSKRVVFHEITEEAIQEAIGNAGEVDLNLVEAQQARRILDRLVGYELSELLWKKIRYGLSAGRVQSVALKYIVDREKEINAFNPKPYWYVSIVVDGVTIPLTGGKSKKRKLKKKQFQDLMDFLDGKKTALVSSNKKEVKTFTPPPPLTTALLQRNANSAFGYSAKRTMGIAQGLYQGVQIGKKGKTGLITYMRTDSYNLSKKAVSGINQVIKEVYGDEYLVSKSRTYSRKSKVAQEAHEAIRPTHLELTPSKVKKYLKKDQFNIYSLIWNRAVATQMKAMKVNRRTPELTVDGEYTFSKKFNSVKFDGFAKVLHYMVKKYSDAEYEIVDAWKENDELNIEDILKEEKKTKPKPRYTEASLIKKLEKDGVGRPSTYASIISTIQYRGYVEKNGKKLFPTDTGEVVSDFLSEYFPIIVDSKFTAEMEDDLDEIANGEEERAEVLKDFYFPFHDKIEKGHEEIKKSDVVVLEESDEKCPECGGPMVVKLGKNGKFLSCADFPDCKGIKPLIKEGEMDKYVDPGKCEKCEGNMILKSGKYGKFWACENYPDCKSTKQLLLKEECPKCGSHLVEKKGKWGKTFIGCSGYPDCKYIKGRDD